MKNKKENGAIVVEATISLSAFIFTIFTVLSIVNICYIQARIGTALNSAAKEISQYSYLYYKLDIDKMEAAIHAGTEEAEKTGRVTVEGVVGLMDALSDGKESIETANLSGLVDAINSGSQNVDDLVTRYADQIADDPKQFIMGMAEMAADQTLQTGKSVLGQVIGKAFMKKNLKASKSDNPDLFLKRYRVVNGLAGLNFRNSTFAAFGKSNVIQLVVTYDVQVIKLLNIDFKFTFRQCSKTLAWGRGISKINPEKNITPADRGGDSVWDQDNVLARGKAIVDKEKQKYEYTDTRHGFDAFDKDKNELISIISVNTEENSYQDPQGIIDKLNEAYSNLYNAADKLSDPIEVTDSNGNRVLIESDPETRKLKIVLVVPDNAPDDVIAEAIRQFIESKRALGEDVEVEIVKGYGSAAPIDNNENGGDNNDDTP